MTRWSTTTAPSRRVSTLAGWQFERTVAGLFDDAAEDAAVQARRLVERAKMDDRAGDARLGLAVARDIERRGRAAIEEAVETYRLSNPLFSELATERHAVLADSVNHYVLRALNLASGEMAWTGANRTVLAKALRGVEARLQAGLSRARAGLVRRADLPWFQRRPAVVLLAGVGLGLLAAALLRLVLGGWG